MADAAKFMLCTLGILGLAQMAHSQTPAQPKRIVIAASLLRG